MNWLDKTGKPIDCLNKQKILNENLQEIAALYQNALDDALLMGCSESSFRLGVENTLKIISPTIKMER